jgi:hypothetical protein
MNLNRQNNPISHPQVTLVQKSQNRPPQSQNRPPQSQNRPPQSQNRPPHSDPMRVLIDLLKLLMKPTIDSKTLIDYVEKYRINPDTYLPGFDSQSQIPLIYYCCSNPSLIDFFIYLISKSVNIHARMVCEDDPSQEIELLYYTQVNYIPTLIDRGAKLNPQLIPQSCEKFLLKGNITKLIALYKHGAITKDQLLFVTQSPKLIFRVLDHLYERIYSICQQSPQRGTLQTDPKLISATNEIMKNYINVFKLFFKNGANINQIDGNETFVQRVLNTYFIDLIRLVVDYNPNFDSVDFLHYSNFDLTNRQIMKIYYNDQNFEEINEFLKDKIVPQKINIKKPVLKKKSQLTK